MSERSVAHSSFVLERTYDAPPERVFAAWSDKEARRRWFVGSDDWGKDGYEFDFREGGREKVSGPGGDAIIGCDARYQDIVPNERIISTYAMYKDGARMSVSLATVEFEPEGEGTHLTWTEQGAFLEGYDDPALRERGTRDLLEALATEVEQARVATR